MAGRVKRKKRHQVDLRGKGGWGLAVVVGGWSPQHGMVVTTIWRPRSPRLGSSSSG